MGDITLSAKVIVESPLVRGVDVSAENNAAMDFARRVFDGVKIVRSLFDEKLVDLAKEVATAQGLELKSEGKNFGVLTGYAATAFDKAGVTSVTVSARDRNPFREITEENEEISDVVKDIFKLTIGIVEKIREE